MDSLPAFIQPEAIRETRETGQGDIVRDRKFLDQAQALTVLGTSIRPRSILSRIVSSPISRLAMLNLAGRLRVKPHKALEQLRPSGAHQAKDGQDSHPSGAKS